MRFSVLFVILAGSILSISYSQAYAQDTPQATAPSVEAVESAKPAEDPEAIARRLKLAEKMHVIRPVKNSVDSAIQRAAARVPEAQRPAFIQAINTVLNYQAIEKISIDAMVETYTEAELEAMVDYYSKPEAVSATEKTSQWASKVQPEIIRIIDKAIMRVRTGGTP